MAGVGVWRMAHCQPGLRWSLSYSKTEKLAVLGVPTIPYNSGDVCLGCDRRQDVPVVEGLTCPIMETPFPFSLLPRLFSVSVQFTGTARGVGTVQTEEKRGLSDTVPGGGPEC